MGTCTTAKRISQTILVLLVAQHYICSMLFDERNHNSHFTNSQDVSIQKSSAVTKLNKTKSMTKL